jgi:hypothetical protein
MTTEVTKSDEARAVPEAMKLSGAISRQIIQGLGKPAGFRNVDVKRLWEHHYRANVVVGSDAVSATVAHSYFVVADSAGHIVTCEPVLRREYQPAASPSPAPETK